jgi:hypothetical protein
MRACGGIGTWRSLVAHLTGGQGVVGSNPAVPTQVRGLIENLALTLWTKSIFAGAVLAHLDRWSSSSHWAGMCRGGGPPGACSAVLTLASRSRDRWVCRMTFGGKQSAKQIGVPEQV